MFSQVNLFAFFTFLMLLYAGIILCSVMQSSIRTVICSVFLYRFLSQHLQKTKLANAAFFFYLFVLLGFDLFIAIDIFMSNGEDCTDSTDWQILALIAVDTFQSLLLLAVAFSMYRNIQERERRQSVLSSFRSSDKGVHNRVIV